MSVTSEAVAPDGYVDAARVAEFTGRSVSWYKRARIEGIGPPFVKIGRSIRYRIADVVQWVESGAAATEKLAPPKHRGGAA